MPFKKGRAKSGGRKPGSPNRIKRELIEKAEELGVDPFEVLLMIAKGDCEGLGIKTGGISLSERLKAAAEAAQYLFPKLRGVEHTGDLKVTSVQSEEQKRKQDQLYADLRTMWADRPPGNKEQE